MPLTGTETVDTHVAVGSALSSTPNSTLAVAMLFGSNPAKVNTSFANVSGGTLTAAALLSGLITRSGPTANFTDTADTAANIIGALPAGTPTSYSQIVFYRNTTAWQATIAGGSGVTLAGSAIVPANSVGRFLLAYTGSGAVTMTGMGADYDNGAGAMPATMLTALGGGAATLLPAGILAKQVSSAGINPGATAADSVLAVYSLPASTFDGIGNRAVEIEAMGSFAATANNKTVKLIFNPATAVVGSTVGTGGTTLASTGVVATSGGGWRMRASVVKYGIANSNTQIGFCHEIAAGTFVQPLAPALITAVESGAILIAVTGNAATLATDIVFNGLFVKGAD